MISRSEKDPAGGFLTRAVLVVVVMSAVGVIACGKNTTAPDGSTNTGGGTITNTMSATIDGVAWRSTSVSADYSPATNNVGASILNLAGGDAPLTQTFGFAVAPSRVGVALTTGTYDVNNGATNARLTIGFLVATYQALSGNGSGSVTLSSFSTTSKTAAGTFNFTLVPLTGNGASKSVTNGVFNVTFK